MTPLEMAQALLAQDALPDDIEEQLEALADEAGAEFERQFDDLFEALFVRLNADDSA